MKIRILLPLLAAVALSAYAFAAEASSQGRSPVTVQARLDRNVVFIGDRLQYTISVSAARGTEVQMPDFGARLGEFTVRNSDLRTREFFGSRNTRGRYTLDIYQTGKFLIPKCAIRYKARGDREWKELQVDGQAVEVKSLLGKPQPEQEIRDIKGPVGQSSRLWLYIILLLLATVIAAALAIKLFLLKKWRGSSLPIRLAHEIAYAELEELARQDLIRQGRIKEYFIALSGIVRHYLENRFDLRAPEMTTEEFLIFVRDSAQLAEGHKSMLREFLSACDLVKFAKYTPPADEIAAASESAKKFIDQTKEVAHDVS